MIEEGGGRREREGGRKGRGKDIRRVGGRGREGGERGRGRVGNELETASMNYNNVYSGSSLGRLYFIETALATHLQATAIYLLLSAPLLYL